MKWLISICLLHFLALAALQIDDDLSDEAIALLDKFEGQRESEAYLYLTGIYADEGEDPAVVGDEILKEYRMRELDQSYVVRDYEASKKISNPEGELFCRSWEDGCLEKLFITKLDISLLLENHKVLIARSEMFFAFDEYSTLTKPGMDEPFAPYRYLTSAQRVITLTAIYQHSVGNTELALSILVGQIAQFRKMLGLQDHLIGKLVALAKLSEIVDVASIIMSETDYPNAAQFIPRLTTEEKEFEIIAAREFGMPFDALQNLENLSSTIGKSGVLHSWITNIIYKPNMTVNALAPLYLLVDRRSEISPAEFAGEVKLKVTSKFSILSKLRNYMGDTMVSVSPNYDKFIARIHDLDAKLVLYNQLHHFRKNIEAAENPYYTGKRPVASDDRVCFDGPLEDERGLRCLRTNISVPRK